ncbi:MULTISPECIES: SDR family NAD(P)-dependent oxidoreductase [unclassified Oceanispirochaeta]|uniref:SDR family NAD(P)-dependent oxidoreductase n=1 Tax=unclassified Oceanispirochaeta TaxID=2635722 RepID=UPI0018F2D423|nr:MULTISPECIES: SDR family oxidoreductase [unclassified Oceanispirochaeta]
MRKKALVTGGGRGIGREIVLELARRGWDIGINYHSSDIGALDTKELAEKSGVDVELFRADIGRKADIDILFDQFLERFGQIDLLVNNAGISTFKPFVGVTEEIWDSITNIDWKGTFFSAQRAARNMIESKSGGVILNMSSNQKDGCWPTASVYGPTKAAIAKFTKHIAMELAPYKIRSIAIAPGYTDVGWPAEDPVHEATDKIPLKRFATPEEIARVVGHLISDDFAYMTGSCLDIDGGALLPIYTENDLDTDWSSTKIQ